MNKRTQPEYVSVTRRVAVDSTRPFGKRKTINVKELLYPPSLKHFIKQCKGDRRFKPMIQNIRQSTIDLLLNEK